MEEYNRLLDRKSYYLRSTYLYTIIIIVLLDEFIHERLYIRSTQAPRHLPIKASHPKIQIVQGKLQDRAHHSKAQPPTIFAHQPNPTDHWTKSVTSPQRRWIPTTVVPVLTLRLLYCTAGSVVHGNGEITEPGNGNLITTFFIFLNTKTASVNLTDLPGGI